MNSAETSNRQRMVVGSTELRPEFLNPGLALIPQSADV